MAFVGIVDYGMGNLDSVRRAVEECGGSVIVSHRPQELARVDRVILPGVGAFAEGMRNLRARGLEEPLRGLILDEGLPFLGICLGMQLAAAEGSEGGHTKGLGWIPGRVQRLEKTSQDVRIPHVGWNDVVHRRPSALMEGIPSGRDFYFVHSYRLLPDVEDDVVSVCPYADGFVAAVSRDNVHGVQFHPEKSQKVGFQVLKNFLSL